MLAESSDSTGEGMLESTLASGMVDSDVIRAPPLLNGTRGLGDNALEEDGPCCRFRGPSRLRAKRSARHSDTFLFAPRGFPGSDGDKSDHVVAEYCVVSGMLP